MIDTINNIIENSKLAYKKIVLLNDNELEELILSVITDSKQILKELDSKKDGEENSFKKETKEEKEIKKVKRKIPTWFSKPNQLNHKILVSYLKLSNKNTKSVKIEDIISTLDMNDNQKIIENFRQMKTVSDKNHAKVFTEEDGFITLWSPVANFIVEEYEKILES
jgi:hypothetical protein